MAAKSKGAARCFLDKREVPELTDATGLNTLNPLF
jgi:hypothetical protein